MRKVTADNSAQWIGEAFGMLRANPVPFLMMGLVYTLISQLPLLGFLVTLLLGPALIGGMLHAADQAAHGQVPRLGQLFQAFTDGERIGAYIALCLPVVGVFVIMVILLLPAYPAIAAALNGHTSGGLSTESDVRNLLDALVPLISAHAGTFFLFMLAYAVLAFVAGMMTFLAPARIMFEQAGALTAMRESFAACRLNFAAYLLLAILLFLISIGMLVLVSTLAFFLPRLLVAIIVLAPFNVLVALSVFAMHRSIFATRDDASEVPPASPPPRTGTLEA